MKGAKMVETKEVLDYLQNIIKNRPASVCDKYHICETDGKLTCQPANHTGFRHPVFFNLNRTQLNEGLTVREWADLTKIAITFFNTEAKCPTRQKHLPTSNSKNS